MSLFVKEEDDTEEFQASSRMEIDEEVIKVKQERLDDDLEEIQNQNTQGKKSNILVDESPEPSDGQTSITDREINDSNSNSNDDDEDQDDPVINEIPIHMKNFDAGDLYLFQYPTKKKFPSLSQESMGIVATRLKPESGVIEVEVPINTEKFFDANKSLKWDGAQTQILKGVFNKSESSKGYYIGVMNEDGLHLNKVNNTTQLRPSFQYIDQLKMQKQQKEKELMSRLNAFDGQEDGPSSNAHVVHMSVKSSSEGAPRLGGALSSKKLEEEETWIDYQYSNEGAKGDELLDSSGTVLQCKETKDEYIYSLINS